MGPKLYLLTDDETNFDLVAAKGLQKRTREVFEKFAAGETLTMKRLEKVGTLARDNFSRGPRVVDVTRTHLKHTPGKRVMHEDGSTSPYNVEMY